MRDGKTRKKTLGVTRKILLKRFRKVDEMA